MRFYDVTKGLLSAWVATIFASYLVKTIVSNLSAVLPGRLALWGDIKENLRFGNLDATDEEIVEAAKPANVDSLYPYLVISYNMEMNGVSNISLGQKQLLTSLGSLADLRF